MQIVRLPLVILDGVASTWKNVATELPLACNIVKLSAANAAGAASSSASSFADASLSISSSGVSISSSGRTARSSRPRRRRSSSSGCSLPAHLSCSPSLSRLWTLRLRAPGRSAVSNHPGIGAIDGSR